MKRHEMSIPTAENAWIDFKRGLQQQTPKNGLAKTFTRLTRVPGLSAGFFPALFLPQTQENKQKMPGNGTFSFRAKARLRTTLVIFPSEWYF